MYKRKKYLVQKKFQLKYVGLILALTFLTAGLCSYVVYYSTMINLGEKLANVYPQGRLVSIVKIVNFRIMISVLLITPLVALIGIFMSHRIAGPIFRMEAFLNNMAAGDLSSRLVLRKGDELMSIANGMNNLSAALNASFARQKSQMEKVIKELEGLRGHAGTDKVMKELQSLIAELDRYKL